MFQDAQKSYLSNPDRWSCHKNFIFSLHSQLHKFSLNHIVLLGNMTLHSDGSNLAKFYYISSVGLGICDIVRSSNSVHAT